MLLARDSSAFLLILSRGTFVLTSMECDHAHCYLEVVYGNNVRCAHINSQICHFYVEDFAMTTLRKTSTLEINGIT